MKSGHFSYRDFLLEELFDFFHVADLTNAASDIFFIRQMQYNRSRRYWEFLAHTVVTIDCDSRGIGFVHIQMHSAFIGVFDRGWDCLVINLKISKLIHGSKSDRMAAYFCKRDLNSAIQDKRIEELSGIHTSRRTSAPSEKEGNHAKATHDGL